MIGCLERTLIFLPVLVMYLVGLPLMVIVEREMLIIMGLMGIKGFYRLGEKERIDWIIIGTMFSITLGFISTNTLLYLLAYWGD